ncbi:MAG: methyltransferase domain-containing protein [Candidatus Hodarchaeales archaeon]|jgi:ubiquinone/menaquinone biosynthesis C-methylase UbiE
MSPDPGQRLTCKDQVYTKEDAVFFNKLYQDQLKWTVSTRKRLYRQMDLFHAKRILEVGSGTGVVLREIQAINPRAQLIGLDNNQIVVEFSWLMSKKSRLVVGDGGILPFTSQIFDIVICNYLLLWVCNPIAIIQEMKRVTRSGGWIACLAEPDYGGRIDYPAGELWERLFLDSLSACDPFIGRKLRLIFHQVGLEAHIGLQSTTLSPEEVSELNRLEFMKFKQFLPSSENSKISKLKDILDSYDPKELFSFMPVFFAIARKRD